VISQDLKNSQLKSKIQFVANHGTEKQDKMRAKLLGSPLQEIYLLVNCKNGTGNMTVSKAISRVAMDQKTKEDEAGHAVSEDFQTLQHKSKIQFVANPGTKKQDLEYWSQKLTV